MLRASVWSRKRSVLQLIAKRAQWPTPLWSVKKFIVKKFRVQESYYLTVTWALLVELMTEILKKFQGLAQITAFLNIPKGCTESA